MVTKPLTSSQSRQITSLIKAVKTNHGIGKGRYVIRVKPSEEIKKYKERITQLSLPHRFGMYKSLKKGMNKRTDIELEIPTIQDNTDGPGGNNKPNHKRRCIFD